MFFFCSGFGLYQSYLRKQVGYSDFIKRRFFKVYIPYIVVVAISALFPFTYAGDHLKAFFSHLLLYKMFIPEYESSFGGQMWYISTLFQFYFVFIPLVKAKGKIKNSSTFLAICGLTSVLWWVISSLTGIADERVWGSFFLQYLWEFALGMFAAEYLWNGGTLKIKAVTLLIASVVGLGAAGMAKITGGILTTFNDPFAFIGYGALALLIYIAGPSLIKKWVRFISNISYELYLVHIFINTLLHQIVQNQVVVIIASFVLSVVVASLMKKVTQRVIKKTV